MALPLHPPKGGESVLAWVLLAAFGLLFALAFTGIIHMDVVGIVVLASMVGACAYAVWRIGRALSRTLPIALGPKPAPDFEEYRPSSAYALWRVDRGGPGGYAWPTLLVGPMVALFLLLASFIGYRWWAEGDPMDGVAGLLLLGMGLVACGAYAALAADVFAERAFLGRRELILWTRDGETGVPYHNIVAIVRDGAVWTSALSGRMAQTCPALRLRDGRLVRLPMCVDGSGRLPKAFRRALDTKAGRTIPYDPAPAGHVDAIARAHWESLGYRVDE